MKPYEAVAEDALRKLRVKRGLRARSADDQESTESVRERATDFGVLFTLALTIITAFLLLH